MQPLIPKWTGEQWQWRGTPHSPKLQHYWNLTNRLFSVISRILCGGGQCILQPQPTSQYWHLLFAHGYKYCFWTLMSLFDIMHSLANSLMVSSVIHYWIVLFDTLQDWADMRVMAMKKYFTGASPSDGLVSYPRCSFERVVPLQRCSLHIVQP